MTAGHKNGRPTTITDVVKEEILDFLLIGMTLADTLTALTLSHRALERACKADATFAKGVKSAASHGKAHHLRRVHNAEPNWQASAWFLERKYGMEFSARLKLDLEGEATMHLVEEVIDAPEEATHTNGTAAPGATGLPSF